MAVWCSSDILRRHVTNLSPRGLTVLWSVIVLWEEQLVAARNVSDKGFKIDTEVSRFSLFTVLGTLGLLCCYPKWKKLFLGNKPSNKTFKFRKYFAGVFLRSGAEERERQTQSYWQTPCNSRDYIFVQRSGARPEPNRCKQICSSGNPTTWQRGPYVDRSMCCSLIKRTSGRDLHAGSALLGSLSLTSLAKKFLGGSCGGRWLGSAGPGHKGRSGL